MPAWVPSVLMDLATLGDFIESSAHRAGDGIFRLEQLPRYAAYTEPAGEEIRVLREGEHVVPELRAADYWIVNDVTVIPMLYDGRGGFVGAGVLPPDLGKQWLGEAETAWVAAEPFSQWWERHRELRRH